jgi:hypothetical protein
MDEKAAGGFLIRAQRIRLQSPASPTRKNRRPPPAACYPKVRSTCH